MGAKNGTARYFVFRLTSEVESLVPPFLVPLSFAWLLLLRSSLQFRHGSFCHRIPALDAPEQVSLLFFTQHAPVEHERDQFGLINVGMHFIPLLRWVSFQHTLVGPQWS
jgi:hypothetical protein